MLGKKVVTKKEDIMKKVPAVKIQQLDERIVKKLRISCSKE